MVGLYSILFLVNVFHSFGSDIRKNGFLHGDIMIGALFSIHEQPTISSSYIRECGAIREEYGMHRVEVLLKTIKEINKNKNILPNVSLGVDIRDTCWYAPIALEQSMDFIINSISNYKLPDNQNGCKRNSSNKPISSLIGPGSSEVTVQVQNLFQLFKIPQIGYSATSMDLSKKSEYGYFLRVVPSDKLQVKALVDVIKYFKWEYISLLNSLGSYGTQGKKNLLDTLKQQITNVCTDQELEVDNKEEMPKIIEVAKLLFIKDGPKVIICYCQGETVTKLLRAMVYLNMTDKGYLIVGTDGWADRVDVLGEVKNKSNNERELSMAAIGSITIRLHSKKLDDFDDYFKSKTYKSSEENPWFQEFWEQKFRCNINTTKDSKYNRTCFGNETLYSQDYQQDSKLGFVVKSVMTVAKGLHNLLERQCLKNQTCFNSTNINGTLLMKEMLNVSFVAYDDEIVSFNSIGDPPGRYDIMNYQMQTDKNGVQKFVYAKIGDWKDDKLVIENHGIQRPTSGKEITPFLSACRPLCKDNETRKIQKEKRCCWVCEACQENSYINRTGEDKCIACHQGFFPTTNRSGCEEILVEFIQWSHISSIVAVVFSCVGIIVSVIITVIFAKFNNTPVVKSSTRELMYIILVGICMSYLTTFALLSKPSYVSCTLTRIMPGLSFSLIFGSLVTKTNRICRILAISKKKFIRRKGRFLTTTAQIVIVLILNSIEVVIIITMLCDLPPNTKKEYPNIYQTYLVCDITPKSLYIPLGFDAVLVCLCTFYAFKTRNLPENFNEAKFIGFTMYTTCIIWVGLVVVYFGAQYKVISLCFAINLSATVAIVLLFMPKIYIILFKPEKNERSAFTTTNEIRCHIGSGKVEYQCGKDQPLKTKNSSQQSMTFTTENRKLSTNINNLKEYPNNRRVSFQNHFHNEDETKSTQTDVFLYEDILLNLPRSEIIENKELNVTRVTLLQFLHENWDKEDILQLDRLNILDKVEKDVLCVEEVFIDEDPISYSIVEDEDRDSSSVKQPMVAQSNSVLTCSPISNVSTDASSTINTLFRDYLERFGKTFSNLNEKKSVKL